LTILQGELESFVSDSSLPPETQTRAGDMLEEVVRLARIVEGLLLVSRLEAGEGQMKRESVNLAEIASSVAEQMELLCQDKLLTFNCDTRRPVIVEGDEIRLRQVVVNLIDNAIKYTPEGGTITLVVRSEGQKAMLEVSDTGIGISPEARPKVFDRFFRAEEARTNRTPGSGLGLSIVKTIVEAHGGSVSVESNENLGTKCRVELALGEAKNPDSREELIYSHENERR
jgi:signal transduction histidine kinase